MLVYAITSATGWVLIVLLVATILYPFLLRSGMLGPVQPFLKRMRFHSWLGYSLAGILLVHVVASMSAGLANRTSALGLDLATVALLLLVGQVMLGRRLSWPKLSMRRVVRRWHFWVMVSIVAFVLGHVALNSGTIQALLVR
jgi:cytochrome b561